MGGAISLAWVINGKSASIDANKQRIAELAAYIDDLTSGRVELTSERATLEATPRARKGGSYLVTGNSRSRLCALITTLRSAHREAGRFEGDILSADSVDSGMIANASSLNCSAARTPPQAEIKELEKAIEEEEAMREKEHEDYLAAKDEMDKAVTALEAATSTLSDATKDHQEGVLNAMASNLKKVMKARLG